MFKDPPFRVHRQQNFYPRAIEMREQIEKHFLTPAQNGPRHQCFDYWYVPAHYTYLRTDPTNVLGAELVDDFHRHLQSYTQSVGLEHVTRPYLSLYVNGCHQNTHSDALNGTLGYVFSLTLWGHRTFTGGETLIAREGAFSDMGRDHKGNATYWEVVPAEFGQLLLFDDRVAHMVPTVQGTMDPLQGRIVLHGHLS